MNEATQARLGRLFEQLDQWLDGANLSNRAAQVNRSLLDWLISYGLGDRCSPDQLGKPQDWASDNVSYGFGGEDDPEDRLHDYL